MRLLKSTKQDVDKDKDGQNVSKLESVEVVLAHCKFVGQLINISTHSLRMMNKVNTEFSSVEIWFTDQARKALCHLQESLTINMEKPSWILQQKLEQMLQKLLQKE